MVDIQRNKNLLFLAISSKIEVIARLGEGTVNSVCFFRELTGGES